MNSSGMVRIACATPRIKLGDIEFNKKAIWDTADAAAKNGAAVVLMPELTITGYSAGDMLHQSFFYEKQLDGLFDIAEHLKGSNIFVILGCYVQHRSFLFNCAALIHDGEVLGLVPKTMLPNQAEFNEMRWFDCGSDAYPEDGYLSIRGRDIPFGPIVFDDTENEISFGVEICRDIWTPVNPSSYLCLAGAHIIFTPAASTELAGKAAQRRAVLSALSQKNSCGYVYSSSGLGESTTDGVFAGHGLIIECGGVLAESSRFNPETEIIYSEIDVARIKFDRIKNRNNTACIREYPPAFDIIHVNIPALTMVSYGDKLFRKYAPNPWIPVGTPAAVEYCKDVFSIQSTALARRMEHIGHKKTLLGVSGGLDSTMALLVACEAHRLLGLPVSDVIAVTLPGFGTSDHTHDNAVTMMKELGVDMREISIKKAVTQHFEDIGHDMNTHDVTYENSQARERTQILMDLANQENALMLGTGDLSEIALGWCTYNGDHMAMYGVNGSVPKTLLPFVIRYVADTRYADKPVLVNTLESVINTPISPELLPPDTSGNIAQKTEDKVGPYVLHDFFIFHLVLSGWDPRKMLFLACNAFDGIFDEATIKKWLITFYKRFFSSQFKRNCAPDGPKATAVSLSSRGDLRMPSDMNGKLWIQELENL